MHGGVFCLIRILPLLDALDSPIKAATESVVEASLAGRPAPDGALIVLDDYRQAADTIDEYDPVHLQVGIASVAILVSEAQWPRYYPQPRSPYMEAEALWQNFDTNLAKARGVPPLSLSDSAFAHQERSWQEAEERVMALSASDPSAFTAHLDLLRENLAASRSTLAGHVEEFGWKPGGPCGGTCDWPACRAERPECVRRHWAQQTLAQELRRRQGAPAKAWYLQTAYPSHGPEEPSEILSEISAEGREVRKVAYYGGGKVEWVAADEGRGRISLSPDPLPPFAELDDRDDIWVEEITSGFFEQRWAEARENPSRPFLAG
ncbi:DUF6881 domain-containing protein [Streptomyces sp. NRRL WC-3742]|uniref:DUF6881 domain-containing protein n=1 Tax=Streptomyces sp. NRRL WC-3742 TaxID=1463934 RepID=UPI0005628644|nr:hypothetical protein [Streptomyces sp. NRRL WC-3742]